jgi:hypothetical protein
MPIDVAKSQMITQLLRNIIAGLSRLSGQDLELRQLVSVLNGFVSQHQIDSNILLNTISKAKEVAASYNLAPYKKDPYVLNLPKMFRHLITEIEHQAKMKELAQPRKVACLALEIDAFVKHMRADR